ncbi:MAG: carbohydrate deacetylase [Candidatus Acidiferrales bacterium]
MKQLILNADDFGMTRGVNEGIIRAHRDGVLTSTTLMAGGAAFEDAVNLAKQNPGLGVGCHLVLVGGCAIAPLQAIPSLADDAGQLPATLPEFVTRVSSGRIRVDEIEREMRAQIEKIRAAGIEPTHLDTHKHTHAHPRVMEALGRVAQSTGITRVRRPIETIRDSLESSRGEGVGITLQVLAAATVRAMTPRLDAISRKYRLRSPDQFLGLAGTGMMGPAKLRQMIEALADGQTEIMVHPGLCDEDLRQADTRLKQERQTELEGLLDAGVRSAIEERGIRLITFREVN